MNGFAIAILAVIAIIIAVFAVDFFCLKVKRYRLSTPKIPRAAEGLSIVMLTDLHERRFGKDNCRLIRKVEELMPDLIVLCGDIVDRYGETGGSYVSLFEALPKIAPTIMVFGNHDYSTKRTGELAAVAEDAGIQILEDACVEFQKNGAVINVIGVADYLRESVVVHTAAKRFDRIPLWDAEERYNILLCHRPVELEDFSQREVDLMLCGHMHGGQLHIPFVRGVFAPDWGKFFPKYDKGLFRIGEMDLIVSSGLGASGIPLRFCLRPEITLIEIYKKSKNS